jgi:hypothetical protein
MSTSVLTDDAVVALGDATTAQLRLKYERALTHENPPRSYEAFVDYVVERGLAEIERQWKTQLKQRDNNEIVKKTAARVKYLRMKKLHEALTAEEESFLADYDKYVS